MPAHLEDNTSLVSTACTKLKVFLFKNIFLIFDIRKQ
jgi:hypothetical protein